MLPRSKEMVEVSWFLAAFGEPNEGKPAKPPRELGTGSWKIAYAMFYSTLGEGRTLWSFSNSMKNARDAFDSWLGRSGRVGWREEGEARSPLTLTKQNLEVHQRLSPLGRDEVWRIVSPLADLGVAEVPDTVFSAIETLEASDPDGVARLEGGTKVYVSTRVERNPKARADALKIHGTQCQVCGFDFAATYGKLGDGYIEVHHVSPIAEHGKKRHRVDPLNDLAVVCANCHRMLHRKRGQVLSLHELRALVVPAGGP